MEFKSNEMTKTLKYTLGGAGGRVGDTNTHSDTLKTEPAPHLRKTLIKNL